MDSKARKFLTILVTTAFILMAALTITMSGTSAMADEPGIRTVTFGVT